MWLRGEPLPAALVLSAVFARRSYLHHADHCPGLPTDADTIVGQEKLCAGPNGIRPQAMVEVMMLGILGGAIKIAEMATVIPESVCLPRERLCCWLPPSRSLSIPVNLAAQRVGQRFNTACVFRPAVCPS